MLVRTGGTWHTLAKSERLRIGDGNDGVELYCTSAEERWKVEMELEESDAGEACTARGRRDGLGLAGLRSAKDGFFLRLTRLIV